ncbi:hypothetical protein F5Y03DRAFT_396897 [Xylaria venustula]|nr:hypothetical protein F5Y03DRAFT_396897 [Xylaria venustula]
MAARKQSQRKRTRYQPQRAVRDAGTLDQPKLGEATASHSRECGVSKPERKSRGATARQRRKFQRALIKQVDNRDSGDAWTEQAHLLGLSDASPPPSPTNMGPSKPKAQGYRKSKGKKYMDDFIDMKDHAEDELQREQRWIPDFAHRKRPNNQPPGVPFSLWMSYKHLDDYMYRHSLSREELESLPLLDDVHEYQNSDGRKPRPITPLGYQWDDHLELMPVEA